MHTHTHTLLLPTLYGGSVRQSNIRALKNASHTWTQASHSGNMQLYPVHISIDARCLTGTRSQLRFSSSLLGNTHKRNGQTRDGRENTSVWSTNEEMSRGSRTTEGTERDGTSLFQLSVSLLHIIPVCKQSSYLELFLFKFYF